MKITVFGHSGFVGGTYVDRYMDIDDLYLPARYSRRPADDSIQIVDFISTVDNYNVFDDPTLDVKTNLLVFTEILESWRNNNPTAIFNFISSWFVYGDTKGEVAYEYSHCNPRGFYSITKRCAEQLLESYATTFGLDYRILRLGNVLGVGDKKASAKKNALQFLINKMKKGEDIDVYEKGDFYRNYIHVDDCVDAIHMILNKGNLNTIYNVATDLPSRFINILNYVKEQIDYKGNFNFIEQKDFHKKVQAKSFTMSTKKLYDLGYQHKYDMEQMIDRIL